MDFEYIQHWPQSLTQHFAEYSFTENLERMGVCTVE